MTRRSVRAGLAAGVLLAAALAAVAGSPYRKPRAAVDVAQLAAAVAREEDHVTASELAAWIRNGKAGLHVIDVRSAAEFAEYHIAGAEHIRLASIGEAPFALDDTLVLYSDGGAHAAQAWVFLRALGYSRVYFLRGGLAEWLDLNPAAPAPSTPGPGSARRTRGGC